MGSVVPVVGREPSMVLEKPWIPEMLGKDILFLRVDRVRGKGGLFPPSD